MVEIMEITEKEKEMILRHRAESARQAELKECEETIRRALRRIAELGGSVELPSIGGKYVSLHNPKVRENNITVNPFR